MEKNPKLVRGVVKLATPSGFHELIEAANDAAAAGYTLVGVVNVGKHIGGVLVYMPRTAPATSNLV